MRTFPWLLALALACGPDKSGDDVDAPGLSSSSSGSDPAPGTTGAPTTSDTSPGTTTGEPSTSTTTGETPTSTTTGEPSTTATTGETPPRTALALATIYGRPSALESVPGWPFDPAASCPNPPDAPCGTPPTLGEPTFLIDGEPGSPEAIALGDRVAVLFPYGDAACDVRCGSYNAYAEDDVEGEATGGNPPADLPCSTDDTNFWLALDFGEIQRPGEHRGFVRLEDSCGAPSQPRQVTFVPQP